MAEDWRFSILLKYTHMLLPIRIYLNEWLHEIPLLGKRFHSKWWPDNSWKFYTQKIAKVRCHTGSWCLIITLPKFSHMFVRKSIYLIGCIYSSRVGDQFDPFISERQKRKLKPKAWILVPSSISYTVHAATWMLFKFSMCDQLVSRGINMLGGKFIVAHHCGSVIHLFISGHAFFIILSACLAHFFSY